MFRYISTNGETYNLVKTSVTLRGGKEVNVFYFKHGDTPLRKGSHYADNMPNDLELYENRNGVPLIKKKSK